MNEINFNALNRSSGLDKTVTTGGQKNVSQTKNSQGADSVQISGIPDLSRAEEAVEEEFTRLRASVEERAQSPGYPPLEAIDRLARMFAIEGPQD